MSVDESSITVRNDPTSDRMTVTPGRMVTTNGAFSGLQHTYEKDVREAAKFIVTLVGPEHAKKPQLLGAAQLIARAAVGTMDEIQQDPKRQTLVLNEWDNLSRMTKAAIYGAVAESAAKIVNVTAEERASIFRAKRQATFPAENTKAIQKLRETLSDFGHAVADKPYWELDSCDERFVQAAELKLRLDLAQRIEENPKDMGAVAVVETWLFYQQRDLLEEARWDMHNSTSTTANLFRASLHQARAKLLEEVRWHGAFQPTDHYAGEED